MEEHVKGQFNKIVRNKGILAPIAETAKRNFELVSRSPLNKDANLYHFAVGHTFKNIDTKVIFDYQLNEVTRQTEPQKYLALQKQAFDFRDDLSRLIDSVRDINSHYAHDFNNIEVKSINAKIISFLQKAFELSVELSYINEREISYEEFLEDKRNDQKIVEFLKSKFYPNEKFQMDEREKFENLDKQDAIEHLMFIEVTEKSEWKVLDIHPVFEIKEGKYLSFYACLFLMSLFLYKSEAVQLISKIKGFKRNDDNEYNSKRNIFTFFSKKFTSQDVNSEERHLMKFRDIIQYLNHYPTKWNKELELQSDYPEMTDSLKRYIIRTEIYRSFPDYKNNERFFLFAIEYFWGKEVLSQWAKNEIVAFSEEEKREFSYEVNTSKEVKDLESRLKELSQAKKKERRQLECRIRKARRSGNLAQIKLLKKIVDNSLFTSYGRNQDRFMNFAVRFLSENNYFGKDARFKVYRFITTDEQEVFLKEQKKVLPKKKFEKFKYHQGKLVYFTTYYEHLSRYPNWDSPFVIENNAVQVVITIDDDKGRIFSIQRNLMVYLLEDALFNMQSNQTENAGKCLLSDYYYHFYREEFETGRRLLEEQVTISKEQKNELKRLFPKRLLHHYLPAKQNNIATLNVFERILEEAQKQERRYTQLLEKAQKYDVVEDFIKRNKGKQFKLRFIRKVWHLMYFKKLYLKRAAKHGHHKQFHITKEEFNDFSKWMFAFDEVSQYKNYLNDYFNKKGFFDNEDFKQLFISATTLDDLYIRTKVTYSDWLRSNKPGNGSINYRLENYQIFFDNELQYISIPHFIRFLEMKNKIQRNESGILQYKALGNLDYLIDSYYYKEKLSPVEYKTYGKLFNKLKSVKLEDTLLYEIAMHYLHLDTTIIEKAKSNIKVILTDDITFDIKDANDKHLYNLIVPFNKIDSLARLISHKIDQQANPKYRRTSFLANVRDYLDKVKYKTDIKNSYEYFRKTDALRYEDLNTLNNHIITNSIKFTRVFLKLEEYFILKNEITLTTGSNRIDYGKIKDINGNKELSKYVNPLKLIRNKAFHFGVPKEDYIQVLISLENRFVKNEIKHFNPRNWEDITVGQKSICRLLMDILHSNLFRRTKGVPGETEEQRNVRHVQQKESFYNNYFNEIIGG